MSTVSKKALPEMMERAIEEGTFSRDTMDRINTMRDEHAALTKNVEGLRDTEARLRNEYRDLDRKLEEARTYRKDAEGLAESREAAAEAGDRAVLEMSFLTGSLNRYEAMLTTAFRGPVHRTKMERTMGGSVPNMRPDSYSGQTEPTYENETVETTVEET